MTRTQYVIRKKGTGRVLMSGSNVPERFRLLNGSTAIPIMFLFRAEAHKRRRQLENPHECEVISVSVTIERGGTL